MRYRFLLLICCFCIATFYIVIDGRTHPFRNGYRANAGMSIITGSTSWGGTTPGSSVWSRETDESADHPTVTAFASANQTIYWRTNDGYGLNPSSSYGPQLYDEYACGTARASADRSQLQSVMASQKFINQWGMSCTQPLFI